MKAAGIQMRHLPTAGGGPALTAHARQQLAGAGLLDRGRRARRSRPASCAPLACFGAQRAPALPDVPTLKELGYDVEFYLWVGLFAPKGTPDADRHHAARGHQEGGRRPSSSSRPSTNLGQDVAYLDQAEFKAFWDADAKRVEDAVRAIGKVDG